MGSAAFKEMHIIGLGHKVNLQVNQGDKRLIVGFKAFLKATFFGVVLLEFMQLGSCLTLEPELSLETSHVWSFSLVINLKAMTCLF